MVVPSKGDDGSYTMAPSDGTLFTGTPGKNDDPIDAQFELAVTPEMTQYWYVVCCKHWS